MPEIGGLQTLSKLKCHMHSNVQAKAAEEAAARQASKAAGSKKGEEKAAPPEKPAEKEKTKKDAGGKDGAKKGKMPQPACSVASGLEWAEADADGGAIKRRTGNGYQQVLRSQRYILFGARRSDTRPYHGRGTVRYVRGRAQSVLSD